MQKTTKYILGGAAALLVVAGTAVGASYITRSSMEPAAPRPVAQGHRAQPQQVVVVNQQPPCDDKNIVGTVGGALAGGVIGNQFGKGSGRTVATVGGAAGGALLGNEYIPTRGVTCR